MKRLSLLIALFASTALLALTEIKNENKGTEKAEFQKVLNCSTPTVLYIYADWCKFCNKTLVEEAAKRFKNVSFVSINNDTVKNNPDIKEALRSTLKDLGEDLGTMGLPTYLFIGKGKIVKKSGGMEQGAFNTLVQEFSEGKLQSDADKHAEWDRLVKESEAIESKSAPAKAIESKSAPAKATADKPACAKPAIDQQFAIEKSITDKPIKVAVRTQTPQTTTARKRKPTTQRNTENTRTRYNR